MAYQMESSSECMPHWKILLLSYNVGVCWGYKNVGSSAWMGVADLVITHPPHVR